jgi:hypothetical protein
VIQYRKVSPPVIKNTPSWTDKRKAQHIAAGRRERIIPISYLALFFQLSHFKPLSSLGVCSTASHQNTFISSQSPHLRRAPYQRSTILLERNFVPLQPVPSMPHNGDPIFVRPYLIGLRPSFSDFGRGTWPQFVLKL